MHTKVLNIANRKVGFGQSCFIIAEAGVNHNGSMEMARQLVDVAAQAGADAVKFQIFKTEYLVTPDAPKADYQIQTTNTTETQYNMLKTLELTEQNFVELKDRCEKSGILFIATPHDQESIDVLDRLGVNLFKIGSGDITNIPYLQYIARKRKPIILSTGMSTLGEVEEAVETILANNNDDLILLHCVSSYPARVEDCNLRAMRMLEIAFKLPVGFSDHTLGIEISCAAVALGACVIEKHFTLDRTLPGPDHKISLVPEELSSLVKAIRNIEKALGSGVKKPSLEELKNKLTIRKSLVAAEDIPKGTIIKEEMLKAKRPGTGISPRFLPEIVGRHVRRDIKADELIEWDMLDE